MNQLKHVVSLSILILGAFAFPGITTQAQTTSFTYQGKLTDNNIAATGTYQMQFSLFDALADGNQIGATQTNAAITVTNGIFTVDLEFGAAAFTGATRFLQISVFSTPTNAFVELSPRQQITSAPYAVRALNAGAADNASNLGGTAANQFVVTTDPRMSDARPPTGGSDLYIRNGTFQPTADISIGGDITAKVFDSNFGYYLGGGAVLTTPGTNNLFVGLGAGAGTSTGGNNSFVGMGTGQATSTGNFNSFFGRSAGSTNTTGSNNTLVGSNANVGSGNLSFATAIGSNAIVTTSSTILLGRSLGQDTVQVPGILNVANQYNLGGSRVLSVAGTDNLFVGEGAGAAITTGSANAFAGRSAGLITTSGSNNSLFGRSAGQSNTTGFDNSFFGRSAGLLNTTGNNNSFFGRSTGQANTIGTFNSFFGSLTGDSNTSGNNNTFVGSAAGSANTSGNSNTFVGLQAGEGSTTGDHNSFFGVNAGNTNTIGSSNTYIGYNAKGAASVTNSTAIGANAFASGSNQVVLGTASSFVVVPGGVLVDGDARIGGILSIQELAPSGFNPVCFTFSQLIGSCSSSLRYKTNIAPFYSGLSLVNRLRPITFDWKEGGMHDLGLGAEDVAAVEPLLVTYNKNGLVEGVKYDRIGVVLLNAVKEQQQIITAQQERVEQQEQRLEAQQREIEALKTQFSKLRPVASRRSRRK
jgi:hypothetical protein